jgi:acyl-CoA thioesterase-1
MPSLYGDPDAFSESARLNRGPHGLSSTSNYNGTIVPFLRRYPRLPGPLSVCLLVVLVSACNGFAIGCGVDKQADQAASQRAPQTPTDPPASRTDDNRPKIAILGDSLTAGLGLLETQSYPHLLQNKIDADGFRYEVINAGVSGDTSAGGLRRLDWVLKEDVRVLIVALGANDGLRGLSVSEMKHNVGRIIETAREKNVIVILAGMEAPPNYGAEYVASFRQAYRDLSVQYRVVFIPFLLDKVAGQATLNQPDGIHPNPQGAEIVADTVWNALKPLLDQISVS